MEELSPQVNSPVSDFPKRRCVYKASETPTSPFVEYLRPAVKVLDLVTPTGERRLQLFPNAFLTASSNARAG
jgi:hypothetical protein